MPKSKGGIVQRMMGRIALRAWQYMQSVSMYHGGGYAGSWWPGAILESFTGAWQQNTVAAPTSTLLSNSAVYRCVTGISSDIAKMRIKVSRNTGGIWEEINEPHGNSIESRIIPLLKKPNHYQNRIKFIESWMLSKLMYGNTYILKHRDGGLVSRLYVLHPGCIKPLVAEDGAVYYELQRDDLAGVTEEVLQRLHERYGQFAIPASEIIHDWMSPLWHQLLGVSPLYACGNSATLGSAILGNSTKFFQNASRPGGHLTAPGTISDETAARLKAAFEEGFSGDNVGKLLMTGDGLEFKPFHLLDAVDAQLKEQFDAAVDDVARAFGYPRWKLGGATPPYAKPDQAQTQYYTDCLQSHIEAIELCLNDGLELPDEIGTEFDIDSLMRMDTQALYESNNSAVRGGWMTPNEARRRANLDPIKGGDTVYLQHQDYPIEKVFDRDDLEAKPAVPAPSQASKSTPEPERSLPPEVIAALSEYRARGTLATV